MAKKKKDPYIDPQQRELRELIELKKMQRAAAENKGADTTEFFEKEEKIVEGVATAIKARTKNGCTGCAYCMPCPHGVNIPKNFRIWNDLAMYGNEEITRQNYFKYLPEAERADKCKACGKCEKVCPQSLSIRENLKQVQKEMEALKNK